MSDTDVATGKFWGTVMTSPVPRNYVNSTRWLTIDIPGTDVADCPTFFVIKKFTLQESAWIRNGYMSFAATFLFMESGDFKCQKTSNPADGYFTYRNPISKDRAVGDADLFASHIKSIAEQQRETEGLYQWDSTILMNRYMTYLLVHQGGVYHLCYNPIHTEQFKQYWLWARTEERGVGGWDWNGTQTRDSSSGRLSTHDILDTYCKLRVHRGDVNREAFADPCCAMLNNADNAAYAALIGDNRVYEHVSTTTWSTFDPSQVAAFSRIVDTMFQTSTQTGDVNMEGSQPLNCLCTGAIHKFIELHIPQSSIMHKFNYREDCSPQMTVNVCNVLLSAREINVRNSVLQAQCGNHNVDLANRTQEERINPQKDPTNPQKDRTTTTSESAFVISPMHQMLAAAACGGLYYVYLQNQRKKPSTAS